MKECNKCYVVKPLNEFYKKNDRKDGLTSNCKVCNRTFSREWRRTNIKRAKDMTIEEKQKVSVMNKRAYLKRVYGYSSVEIDRLLK